MNFVDGAFAQQWGTIGSFDFIIPHPIFTIISYLVVFMYNRV